MEITTSQWHEFSTVVERGPLVYSLKVRGEDRIKNRGDKYGAFTEVFPIDEWRFGLIKSTLENTDQSIEIVEKDWNGSYPWNLENNPIELKLKGVKVPEWELVNGAPVFPHFGVPIPWIERNS